MSIRRNKPAYPGRIGTLLRSFRRASLVGRVGLLGLIALGSFACGTLDPSAEPTAKPSAASTSPLVRPSLPLPQTTRAAISAADLEAHVLALTSPLTAGRRAGTDGERVAADYLARVFEAIGLDPADGDGTMLQHFSFTAGIDLGPDNELSISRAGADATPGSNANANEQAMPLELDDDWRPLAFSRSGSIPASPVVEAGYGLVVPAEEGRAAIDDYAGLEVRDRWVLVYRDLPASLEPERRQALQLHASLRYKAMIARDKGAIGILFVSGPLDGFREELVPLRFDASLAGTRIAVVSIRNAVAEELMADPENIRLGGRIDLETREAEGTNVVGRLQVGDTPSRQVVVLGAHFDHLGHGEGSSSLASGADVGMIHRGADDNASGTALLIEIAEFLVAQKRSGAPLGERDFVFAAWSGEELGLLGSYAWVDEHINPHNNSDENDEGPIAYLNFDMVGRLTKSLIVQGLGSSPAWAEILDRAKTNLTLALQQDSYLPTDSTSFYTQGVPVLNAFTGVHSEYHTPRDQPDLLNLEGTVQIGELFAQIAENLSRAPTAPSYRAQAAPAAGQGRTGFRVFLGTVPDYAQTDLKGVRLSGVAPGGPAETAGLRSGDIIVEVDGRPIENLYDYTYALEALRVGISARVTIVRANERLEFEVVPASRD